MCPWILFLLSLSGVSVLANAWKRTFCKEENNKCNTRDLSCPKGHEITISIVYYVKSVECSSDEAWQQCCCNKSVPGQNDDYKNDLSTNCNGKNTCNVYETEPLSSGMGKLTVLYNCQDLNGTLIDKTNTGTSSEADNDISVPVVVTCAIMISAFVGVVVIVIYYRLRKRRRVTDREVDSDRKAIGSARAIQEVILEENPQHYAESNEEDDAQDDKKHLTRPGDRLVYNEEYNVCKFSVVNNDTQYTRTDVHEPPGVYDRVAMVHKLTVHSDPTYDHVVHGEPDKPDMTYDHVGNLKRKPNSDEAKSTHYSYTSTENDGNSMVEDNPYEYVDIVDLP